MAMVFGNLGPDSGSGVAFTRDPATGEHRASTATTCPMPRARTSSPASATRKALAQLEQLDAPRSTA